MKQLRLPKLFLGAAKSSVGATPERNLYDGNWEIVPDAEELSKTAPITIGEMQ